VSLLSPRSIDKSNGLFHSLLFSKMRMIVINPETPTGVFFKAGLISQDSEASIFNESYLVKVLKRFS
jgi:hypothetical protein